MVHGYFSLVIIFLSFVFLYFFYRYTKVIIGTYRLPFISLFFLFKYIMLIYIGSVILNVYYIEYHVNIGTYEKKELLLNIWLYSSAGLFLIPTGMAVANGMLRYNSLKETNVFMQRDIYIDESDYKNNILFFVYIFIFFISLIILFIYKYKIGGTFPIIGVFQGFDSQTLALLRSEASNNFQGRYWLYMMFIKYIPLILLLITFFLKDYSLKYKVFFYILIFYNSFVSLMDIQKAPIIKIIFLLALVKVYKDGYISKKILIIIGIIAISLALFMYVFFMGNSDKHLFELLSLPLERIFIGNIVPFYWWQNYQEHIGYLYGTSFPNPAHIFSFEWRRITVEVMNFTHPSLARTGIVGSMPTVFFAQWFINFGTIMALFSMILFGFIIQLLDIIFIRKLNKNKNLYVLTIFIVTIFYFGKFAITNFEGFIIDPNFYIPFIILLFIKILKNTLKKSIKWN